MKFEEELQFNQASEFPKTVGTGINAEASVKVPERINFTEKNNFEDQKDIKKDTEIDKQHNIEALKTKIIPLIDTKHNTFKSAENIPKEKRMRDFVLENGETVYIDLDEIYVEPRVSQNRGELKEMPFDGFSVLYDGHELGTVSVGFNDDGTASVGVADIGGKKQELKRSFLSMLKNKLGIDVTPPQEHTVNSGKGIGSEGYIKINKWLKENYNTVLASNGPRSPDAEMMWKSLEKKGMVISSLEPKSYYKKKYRFK